MQHLSHMLQHFYILIQLPVTQCIIVIIIINSWKYASVCQPATLRTIP